MNATGSRIEGDDPTQQEINRAQRRPRELGKVDFAAYFRFLAELPEADPEELRRRPVLRGEPFRL